MEMQNVETPVLGIHLQLPDDAASVPFCRRVLRFALQELAVEEGHLANIEMVVSEATANVVLHAFDGPGHHYSVRLELFPDLVRLFITDTGCGFRRSPVAEPDLEQISGRGLWLIEQLADSVAFSALVGGGTLMAADFRLTHPPKLG